MLKKILSKHDRTVDTGRLDRTSGWACRKRVCVKSGHDRKTNYGTDYFLLGSVDHSRIRGAFYRPLEKQRIQVLLFAF